MNVEYPNQKPLSDADIKALAELKALIEQALADGVLTESEMRNITGHIHGDGEVSVQELQLVQHYICQKIQTVDLPGAVEKSKFKR
ncbi:MAG TPA: hypothetical protein IGS53_19795 [Leptolyngbyaceae cyanobacterium M33_DOE_097]|uniref:Uncharacterized protein n=1 Tax=Oscillatoriales cyanobacterium SpSt-418 TaxID=2282169 RepID=A0A7C3KD87_9CYAN|nr:hypothetical protein [Leptolyngbyaceae cyanobacterium M33_DOE_097]